MHPKLDGLLDRTKAQVLPEVDGPIQKLVVVFVVFLGCLAVVGTKPRWGGIGSAVASSLLTPRGAAERHTTHPVFCLNNVDRPLPQLGSSSILFSPLLRISRQSRLCCTWPSSIGGPSAIYLILGGDHARGAGTPIHNSNKFSSGGVSAYA